MGGESVRQTAERLRGVIAARPFDVDGGARLTASLGAVAADTRAASAFELILRADRALYSAKSLGRNRTVVANI
jgi:diguanylate cyclase (GGDEF)-like protein